MQRRDFLKISVATGATAALEGCGNPDHQLIRFIPDEDLIPDVATWKPSICTMCGAGCGLLVRVMQGEAEVVRNGQLGLLKMGVAKKIEGNPAHPVNQGKLCPRGQAGLQITYHPDRVMGPMARTGDRGTGQFQAISWDDAIKRLVTQLGPLATAKQKGSLAFLTTPLHGQRRTIASNFAAAFGGPAPLEFGFFDYTVVEEANSRSFGQGALPTVDLSQANYVISFGADFLGTWNSPVSQSLGYGAMRRGRPGQRGKLVQVGSRLSQTGANADEFVACPPGMEGALALSLAHVIIADKLRPASAGGATGAAIDGWAAGLPDYAPEKISAQTRIPAATITRIAHEAASSGPAGVLIGDAATAQTNGVFNALAANALNALLGNVGKPGGIQFSAVEKGANRVPVPQVAAAIGSPKVLLLNGANPIFASPNGAGIRDALMKVPFIASFGSFVDDTSALADLILPDHSPLESWLDDTPDLGTLRQVHSVAPPVMSPLHETRAMPDVLLSIAQQVGGDAAKSLPWKTYEDAIKASVADLQKDKNGSVTAASPDEFWTKVQAQGGWWSSDEHAAPISAKSSGSPVKAVAPQFDGDPSQFPFHFLPFPSQLLYDGSLAHLPWLQEAPDPLSTVMWNTWVEINPTTAGKLSIQAGDVLEVASQHGKIQAHAIVSPGIAPDVVAMPIGQGHERFTRYASNRGANPISILAPLVVAETSALAWAATRVSVTRIGPGSLAVFAGALNEKPPQIMHR